MNIKKELNITSPNEFENLAQKKYVVPTLVVEEVSRNSLVKPLKR